MRDIGDRIKLGKRGAVFSAIAILGYCELRRFLHLVNSVYQISGEEIEQYLKELEFDGLVKVSEDRVFISSKGVEAIKEVGLDEESVNTLLKSFAITVKPILMSLHLPKLLTKLDSSFLRAEDIHKLVHEVEITPPMLLLQLPKVIQLDTYKPPIEYLSESPEVLTMIDLVKPKLKLLKLDKEYLVIESSEVFVKPISIELEAPKLVDMSRAIPTIPESRRETPTQQATILETLKEEVSYGNEVADVLEGFFEVEEGGERDIRSGLATVTYDRPVVIVAVKPENREYIDVLRHFLHVTYRIVVGGLPQGEYFTLSPSRDGLELERVLYESSRPSVVKVIEITEPKPVNLEILRNRLRELLVEGLSFTVLYVNETVADKIVNFVRDHRGEFGAKILIIRPRELSQEQLHKLAALSWGYVGIAKKFGGEGTTVMTQYTTPNIAFTMFAERFYNDLEDIYRTALVKGIVEEVKSGRRDNVLETSEHYFLKVFTAYYFVEKEHVNINDIAVEESLCGGVPDVYVRSRGIAVEIETLYGEGLAWPNKLRQTLEKYRGCREISEIWLVIPPLQASMHLKYLATTARRLRESGDPKSKTRILTVDLGEEKFVPVEEIGRKIREALRS
jgi:hypothetical protein